jgi:Heterokaryon incompatibility protein (HET)
MSDIYTNASCTIAAHSAGHADDGFLNKSLAVALPDCLGKGGDGSTCSEQIFISLTGHPHCDIDDSPFSGRGWVLQERLLSERTIHFTPGRLYWESRLGIIADDGVFVSYRE